MHQNYSERKIYKVSQINQAARQILEANFSNVWIEGEISNLVIPSSGHIYFSLKDETAQVRCVMFRNYNQALNFKPQNGDHIILQAEVSLYEPRGDYQLLVFYLEQAGAGILHAKFLALKNKLEKEGLFAVAHKKTLPKMPRAIGVITSPTGAAIRDILTVLKRRFATIPVIIYPTQVQGAAATPQIVQAIQQANLRNEVEVLILTRGGGSLEDLWCFNEESVARAIFASTIPLISAVGHEIDFTIADFVADQRAPTPSVAAELAVPDISEWLNALQQLLKRIGGSAVHKLEVLRWKLANLQKRLRHPREKLLQQAQKIDEFERRLFFALKQKMQHAEQRLQALTNALNLVNPLAILNRGFAIITKDQQIVRNAAMVQAGDQVDAQLAEGRLECVVKTIKN